MARGEAERGVVLGGSGNGEAMAANRVKRVRCALCWNVETARLARQHNDANMISLGERLVTESDALKIVRTWWKAVIFCFIAYFPEQRISFHPSRKQVSLRWGWLHDGFQAGLVCPAATELAHATPLHGRCLRALRSVRLSSQGRR